MYLPATHHKQQQLHNSTKVERAKQKVVLSVDLLASILGSLFAPFNFVELHNYSTLLTTCI